MARRRAVVSGLVAGGLVALVAATSTAAAGPDPAGGWPESLTAQGVTRRAPSPAHRSRPWSTASPRSAAITHVPTGTPLFMGQVGDPTARQ